ncbi:hypothetical protein TB2_027999 [Malus domestica]
MPDVHSLVNDFLIKLKKRKIEGSLATAKQTAELIRSVISAQRVPYTNQAGALIDAVKAVGEQLIAANPVGRCFERWFNVAIFNEEILPLVQRSFMLLGHLCL